MAAPEVFTFEHAAHKQPPLEGLSSGKSPVGTPNQAWLCLDLCEVLCRLAEESADQRASVMQVGGCKVLKRGPDLKPFRQCSVHRNFLEAQELEGI